MHMQFCPDVISNSLATLHLPLKVRYQGRFIRPRICISSHVASGLFLVLLRSAARCVPDDMLLACWALSSQQADC